MKRWNPQTVMVWDEGKGKWVTVPKRNIRNRMEINTHGSDDWSGENHGKGRMIPGLQRYYKDNSDYVYHRSPRALYEHLKRNNIPYGKLS